MAPAMSPSVTLSATQKTYAEEVSYAFRYADVADDEYLADDVAATTQETLTHSLTEVS